MVLLRHRPGLVVDVTCFDSHGSEGMLHLLTVEYFDGWDHPEAETVIWEREIEPQVLSRASLPDELRGGPDDPERLEAFLDAFRWSAVQRLSTKEGSPTIPLVSAWHSAIQLEDYQLYPVLKALNMPRVTLLLADDVGLGKTIEAGLILRELLARRRIRRCLVLCPASLQLQWQEELWNKFSLRFTVVDREQTFRLQRELGPDANPWVNLPRAITSMDYLRQPDVLESFLQAAKRLTTERQGLLPWDLLIVDEAHNLAPSPFGSDSQRCHMLREISPYFEHRLFLTATPHDGYTRTFSGLLELLDPVRFQQKVALEERDREQIRTVVIRRMKSELNELTLRPRFPRRYPPQALPVDLGGLEKELYQALKDYQAAGKRLLQARSKEEQNLGYFFFTILTKRLLSSSYAFARTWWEHVVGLEEYEVGFEEAAHARTRAEEELTDDEEKARREADALRQGGGWMRPFRERLQGEIDRVSRILSQLGWSPERLQEPFTEDQPSYPDAKWERLREWIERHLRDGERFKDDERLIIFTEYRDTQQYLLWRFRQQGWEAPEVQELYGGANLAERERIKQEFNDFSSPLRVLVATDAASEGLNLQNTCRYVIHYEIPWNPMRLEQRNGRVDRHGQARDVHVFHFVSDEIEDQKFLARVAEKVNQVREDLGSVSKVIDAAVLEYFMEGPLPLEQLEERIEQARRSSVESEDLSARARGSLEEHDQLLQRLRATELELGLSSERLARLLCVATAMEGGQLVPADEPGVYRFRQIPPSWEGLIESTLRIQEGAQRGSLPKLVFDPAYFEHEENGRVIFRPKTDTVLIRLGHPIMRRALTVLKRHLWGELPDSLRRWTLLGIALPGGLDGVLLLHLLVTATNELRELVHEELRTIPFGVRGANLNPLQPALWEQLSHQEPSRLETASLEAWLERLQPHWPRYRETLEEFIEQERGRWEEELHRALEQAYKEMRKHYEQAFRHRLAEIERDRRSDQLERYRERLQKELERARQLALLPEEEAIRWERIRELERKIEEEELKKRQAHLAYLRNLLEGERERMLERVLPRRHALAQVHVQPVAVEIWVPLSS